MIEEKIQKWLEKSGYPLELYVFSCLKEKGYYCGKSEYYTDIETKVSREIDVTAYKHGAPHDTYSYTQKLIFECKKSNKPLVNLCTDQDEEPLAFHHLLHGDQENAPSADFLAYMELKKLTSKELEKEIGLFSKKVPLGYSLVPALGTSDANIYSGLLGLAKASTFYRRSFLDFFREVRNDKKLHVQDRNPFEFHMATLVVDAPLYNATLLKSGELSISPSSWSVLKMSLPWDIQPDQFDTGYCLHIVTKEALPEFLESVEKLHTYLSQNSIVSPLCVKDSLPRKIINFKRRLRSKFIQ